MRRLATILLCLSFGSASALTDVSLDTCESWLTLRKIQLHGQFGGREHVTWVQGYMMGQARALPSAERLQDPVGENAAELWLHAYCPSHPRHTVRDAAMAFAQIAGGSKAEKPYP